MITEIQIAGFNLITFFRKCSVKHKDISFLYTGEKGEEHEWSILGFNSKFKIIKLQDLSELEKPKKSSKFELPFTGGWIGYLSYDGETCFRRYNSALLYNHKTNSIVLVSDDSDFEKEVRDIWGLENPEGDDIRLQFKPVSSRKWYDTAFKKVMKHIYDGDIYQMNLTYQLESGFNDSSIDLFTRLTEKNPAEMSAYLARDNQEIISCSPERFVRLKDRKLETFPIKGTVARGRNDQEDRVKIEELLTSKKEEAELGR